MATGPVQILRHEFLSNSMRTAPLRDFEVQELAI